jgi:CheY-like chemotaxis protein
MKVLVADDEPGVRATVSEYLTLHGVEVLEASNGLEALLQVKHARPNAIVLDLRMPRLGGLDALKRIHAFDPAIVVVVVTADTDEALHRQALTLGARTVMLKPVALPELLAALNRSGFPEPSRTPRASPAAVTPAPPPAPPAPAPASSTRVLVVDDDEAERSTMAEFLTLRGYAVSEAASAVAGLQALVEPMPDIVLLDVAMPGLSGADALPTIRALAPDAIVIMISGIGDEELAKRTLAHGAFDYIVKPANLDYLTQALETARAMKALE